MSKFTPSAKGAPVDDDNDPDVKMKKVSAGHRYKMGDIPDDKVVGGSSGPGYNFTGITPGSELGCVQLLNCSYC